MPEEEHAASVPAFDVQGHRGARGLLPENTIPAFVKALALGVTTLEMDVVISGDGQVVVSHDPWFSARIASLPSGEPVRRRDATSYRLYEMDYDRIARFDVGRRGHPRFHRQVPTPACKPLLADVVDTAEAYVANQPRGPVWYSIETKSRPEWDGIYHPDPATFTRLLYEVLQQRSVVDRSIIQSFDVRTLQQARLLDPAWRTSLLVEPRTNDGVADNLARLGFTPSIYSPHRRLVRRKLVDEVHRRSMRLIPWTVNTLRQMKRFKRLGVDGFITDYPDVAARL